MKYNIAIVEDYIDQIDILKSYINKYSEEKKAEFNIFVYEDGDEIIYEYEAKYDIIFLDIEMKRLDGMTTARKIRQFDQDVIIIFVTNMVQYAISGYSVGALSFLLKPVPYFAFASELTKSIDKINKRKHKHILVQTKNGITKLATNEVMFIESFRHNIIIHTPAETYNTRGTIKALEEELSGYHFYKCNSGYLINLAYVAAVKNDEVIIGARRLKISRPKKKSFMEALVQYLGEVV